MADKKAVGNLDFAALIPDRPTFTDQDGQVYEWRTRIDFGAVDLARTQRLQREIQECVAALEEAPEDEELAAQFEVRVSRILGMLLPELAEERLRALTLGQKTAMFRWWTVQEDAREGEALLGEGPSDQPAL